MARAYARRVIIDSRYNGPPGTGNGGYSAGAFALASGRSDDAVEVTLRLPPPLGVAMRAEPDGDRVGFWEGDRLVAQVGPGTLAPDDVADPISWDEAVAAAADSPALTRNPFPTCYVCGVDRADGMRLFPGRLAGGRTATPWTVPGEVEPELVWAALDCPGGWATAMDRQPYVLGRLTARVLRLPGPGEHCVISGALTGQDGRKAFVITTIYGGDGSRLAHARATWISLPG